MTVSIHARGLHWEKGAREYNPLCTVFLFAPFTSLGPRLPAQRGGRPSVCIMQAQCCLLEVKRNRVLTSHGPALLVVRPLRADVHMPNM